MPTVLSSWHLGRNTLQVQFSPCEDPVAGPSASNSSTFPHFRWNNTKNLHMLWRELSLAQQFREMRAVTKIRRHMSTKCRGRASGPNVKVSAWILSLYLHSFLLYSNGFKAMQLISNSSNRKWHAVAKLIDPLLQTGRSRVQDPMRWKYCVQFT
jgi:hypothetical protein